MKPIQDTEPTPISQGRFKRLLEVDPELAHELRRWVDTRRRHMGRERKILDALDALLPEPPDEPKRQDAGTTPAKRRVA